MSDIIKVEIENESDFFKTLRDGAYVSPSGVRSVFLYDFLTRQNDKNTAIHQILDKNETILQDMGASLSVFPLNVYFAGTDAAEKADAFYNSLFEHYTPDKSGIFESPRWGNFNVIPMGEISQTEDYVEGAGISRVTVTLRETTSVSKIESALINASTVRKSAISTAENAISAFDKLLTTGRQQYSIFKGSIKSKIAFISKAIESAVDLSVAIKQEVTDITNDIYSALDEAAQPAIIFMQISAMFQTIMGIPNQTINTVKSIANLYYDISKSFKIESDNSISKDDAIINAGTAQFLQNTIIANIALGFVSADYSTREEAGDAIDTLVQLQAGNIAGSDYIAETLTGYFLSDSDTQASCHAAVFDAVRYLLLNSFGLKTARKYKLDGQSDAITLCYKHYGKTDNETLDFFLRTNAIKDSEFYELDAGRDIVIYV